MSQASDPSNIKALDDVWPIGKKKAYYTLFVVLLLGILDFVDRQVLVSLFPYLKTEFQLSDTQLGLLVSIVNISLAVLALPSSYFIDRWSRKKMIFVMGAIWSMATGACAFVNGYSHLLFARFFVGAGEAGYNPGAQSLISASFPKRMRATMISILQTAMGVGAPIGVMVGAYIATHWGWRHAFGIVAIPGLILSFLALFITDFKNTEKPKEKRSTPWIVEAGQLLAKPSILLACLAQGVFLIYQMSLLNWLPTYFNRVAEMPMVQAGGLAALCMMVGSFMCPLGGMFADFTRVRSARLAALMVCVLTTISFLFTITAYNFVTPGSSLQIACLMGAYLSGCTLSMMGFAIVNDLALPQQRATSVSLLIVCQNALGMAVGPLLTGFLSDMFDLSTAMSLCAGGLLISALFYLIIAFTFERDLAKMPHVEVRFD